MDDRQKKITINFIIGLGVTIVIGLAITLLVLIIIDFDTKTLMEWIIRFISWLLSTFGFTFLGIMIKVWINKKQLKEIKKEVKVIKDLQPKDKPKKQNPKRQY